MSGAHSAWAQNVSHLIVIGIARQSLTDKKILGWEEISAVAMSFQNVHLATKTSTDLSYAIRTYPMAINRIRFGLQLTPPDLRKPGFY